MFYYCKLCWATGTKELNCANRSLPLIVLTYNFIYTGTWMVYISTPDEVEKLLRAEGEYPSRGSHEGNIMWIYNKLKLPPPMVLS